MAVRLIDGRSALDIELDGRLEAARVPELRSRPNNRLAQAGGISDELPGRLPSRARR